MAGLMIFRCRQICAASLLPFFLALLAFCSAQFGAAHPLGNFSVNRYSRLEVSSDKVRVFYVLDMAEIPTFQEMGRLDTDGDGAVSEAEKKAYAAVKAREIASRLDLQINGNPLTLIPKDWKVTLQLGQGNLPILRLESTMETEPGALPATIYGAEAQSAIYRDKNEPERIGWREIVIRCPSAIGQTVGTNDVTAGLTHYPADRFGTPLDVRFAEFSFLPTITQAAPDTAVGWRELVKIPDDRFAALIAAGNLTPGKMLLLVLIAAGLGALHALSPGHGKTLVGAYLIGSRGTPRHALFLGMIVTATHTAGVFALGLVTLFASRYLLPEALYPWLSTVSGLVITLIGIAVLLGRSGLHHHHECADEYLLAHGHPHEHTLHHDEELTARSPGQRRRHADHELDFSHRAEQEHEHGHHLEHGHGHSHLPPPGTPVTWRSLFALGISGGLVPCPSALVVLLGAIALHRIAFGLVLIIAFSLGLAGVLTGIGVLMVKARDVLARRVNFSYSLILFVQKLGPVLIMCIGIGITLPALLALARRAGGF
jgi:nickel/cobalt transporter (NicO) family protein